MDQDHHTLRHTPHRQSCKKSLDFSRCGTANFTFHILCWRVRRIVAKNFTEIQAAVGKDIAVIELLPAFNNLLKDMEGGIRRTAAGKTQPFCAALPFAEHEKAILQYVLPVVKDMVSDPNQHVKAALAVTAIGLASILGSELTMVHLLLIYLTLLRDETELC